MNSKEFAHKLLPIIDRLQAVKQEIQSNVAEDCKDGYYDSFWVSVSDALTTTLVGLDRIAKYSEFRRGTLNFVSISGEPEDEPDPGDHPLGTLEDI